MATTAPEFLSIRGVSRSFPATGGGAPTVALQATDLAVAENDFITILGPSGCGKSTLLRIVAGLDRQTSGEVLLEGRRIAGPGAERGMVFQSYTLFPWLPVLDNVCFGLRERGLPRAQQLEIAGAFLDKVGLRGFENHFPKQLSGGMQQRVAIARALAFQPAILLMDEPFGALDEMTRERLNAEVLKVWAQTGTTVIFVTHSIPEAVFLSTRVVVMSARPGRISEVIDIDLPQPRGEDTRETDRYYELVTQVREALREGHSTAIPTASKDRARAEGGIG